MKKSSPFSLLQWRYFLEQGFSRFSFSKLQEEYERNKLKINLNKTEYMTTVGIAEHIIILG